MALGVRELPAAVVGEAGAGLRVSTHAVERDRGQRSVKGAGGVGAVEGDCPGRVGRRAQRDVQCAVRVEVAELLQAFPYCRVGVGVGEELAQRLTERPEFRYLAAAERVAPGEYRLLQCRPLVGG